MPTRQPQLLVRRLVIASFALTLLISGCGSDDASPSADSGDTEAVDSGAGGSADDAGGADAGTGSTDADPDADADADAGGGGAAVARYPTTAEVQELVDASLGYFGDGDCVGPAIQDTQCRFVPAASGGTGPSEFSARCGFSPVGRDEFVDDTLGQVTSRGDAAEEVTDLGAPAVIGAIAEGGGTFLSVFYVDETDRDSYCSYQLSPPFDERDELAAFDEADYRARLLALADRLIE